MNHSCYECHIFIIFDGNERRVHAGSPRGMQGSFLVCGEACAEKLSTRLADNGWSLGEKKEEIIPRPYPAGTRYGIAKREDIKW